MKYLQFRNWEKFQHYHNRKPPWVKLYWSFLCSPNVYPLSDVCKYHVIAIMSLASQHDNKIPFNKAWISHAIHANSRINWDSVLSCDMIDIIDDASTTLADCKQSAILEKRRERDREEEDSAEVDKADSAPVDVFCEMPCTGKHKKYLIEKSYIASMKQIYPGVDVEAETLRSKGWLINNPKKQKTYDGITRFLGSWYSRVQNDGNRHKPPSPDQPKPSTVDLPNGYQWQYDEAGNKTGLVKLAVKP